MSQGSCNAAIGSPRRQTAASGAHRLQHHQRGASLASSLLPCPNVAGVAAFFAVAQRLASTGVRSGRRCTSSWPALAASAHHTAGKRSLGVSFTAARPAAGCGAPYRGRVDEDDGQSHGRVPTQGGAIILLRPVACLVAAQWLLQVLGKLQQALAMASSTHRHQQLLVRGLARLERVEEVVVAIKGANPTPRCPSANLGNQRGRGLVQHQGVCLARVPGLTFLGRV